MKKVLLMAVLVCASMGMWAQSEKVSPAEQKHEKAVKLTEEGIELYDADKMEEALKKYNAALKLESDFYSPYYEKALTQNALGKTKDAKKTLLESIKKCPEEDLGPNYSLLATIEDNDGNTRQAIDYYHKALMLSDGDDKLTQNVWFNLGVAFQRLGVQEPDSIEEHYNKALNCYTFSLVRNPMHASSYYGFYDTMTSSHEHPSKWGYSWALGVLGWYAFFGSSHSHIEVLAEMPDKWAKVNLAEEELDSIGPLTRLSYEAVQESAKMEPSEYGKFYDLFMYAVPKVAEKFKEKHPEEAEAGPTPLQLIHEDMHNEFLWPLYAKMIDEGVFETFCHVIAARVKDDYIANANWMTKNKDATDKLVKMLNDGRYFDSSLREEMQYGKVPSVAQVADADDAHARNEEAKLACIYYMNHYIGTEEMQQAAQFILSWSMVSPDVMIPIGEGESIFLKEETQPYLVAYMASCALIQLDKGEKSLDEDEYLEAMIDALNYYNHNKEKTGTDAELDRLFELGVNDKDAFDKEVKSKFPKQDEK